MSNGGDDKKDGLSAETAVYSWKRAKKVRGGDNSIEIFIAAGASRSPMLVAIDSMRYDPDPDQLKFLVGAWKAAFEKAKALGWLH